MHGLFEDINFFLGAKPVAGTLLV